MKMYIHFFYILLLVGTMQALTPPREDIQCYGEIAVQCKPDIHHIFNHLKPEQRVFLYYIYRASMPAHYLYADQVHRHAVQIMDLCETILQNKNVLHERSAEFTFHVDQFIDELVTYLVYLWTNHGQYFLKEKMEQKRTPSRIGCTQLTKKHLQQVLKALNLPQADHLLQSMFDHAHEPTLCVAGDIDSSATNVYHPDFTNADYACLSAAERRQLNAYYDVEWSGDKRKPHMRICSTRGMYAKELSVSVHWLQKAHEHVKQFPDTFDQHMCKSLDYLIQFLKTGDEELFKKHSVSWTKTNNQLDYVFGWIEVYNDPKQIRGAFQTEVTAKTVDISALNKLLPSLEQALPFPDEYKRKNLHDAAAIPNASINTILTANGGCGPCKITAAYCLPNYAELRSEHGSKQIIYQSIKDIGQLINPDLTRSLFNLPDRVEWLNTHDPEGQLHNDIWNVHCILHETLGHGSGRLHKHTFRQGDELTIDDVTYAIGETIDVTSKNNPTFLGKYGQSVEELRAEIIALYTSIYNFDELAQSGLYKDWPEKIGKDQFIKELILDMAWTGLRRLLVQPSESSEIHGAHAQANTTIMHYLLDGGGLTLKMEPITLNGQAYTVIGFEIEDIERVTSDIVSLAKQVQRIKSTGDGQALNALMETYGRWLRKPEYRDILQTNYKAAVGNIKVLAYLFPHYEPIKHEGKIVDVHAYWPKDIIDQSMRQKSLAYRCT